MRIFARTKNRNKMETKANWAGQVGDSNYSDLPVQPLEYATKHGLPPALCKVLKYLLRDRGACKLGDYAKLRDCIAKGAELTKKYREAYEVLDIQLASAIYEIGGMQAIPEKKKYLWGYAVMAVMLPSRHYNQGECAELLLIELEDGEAQAHGYRQALEDEKPDLDYARFGGRKWIRKPTEK